MSSSVLPMFSSKSFIVSDLTFRSLIHFEFIFVYGVRMFALRFGGPAHHSAPQLRRPEPFTGYANWAGLPALVNAQTGGRSSWDGPGIYSNSCPLSQ